MEGYDIWYEGSLATRCVHRENKDVIWTDAPKDNHGRGEKFSPTDLLAISLGSCILTIMGIQAERLKVDLSGTKASVTKEMAKTPPRRIAKITILVTCPRSFSSELTAQLEKAALHCPVHHSLHPEVVQDITFQWGSS